MWVVMIAQGSVLGEFMSGFFFSLVFLERELGAILHHKLNDEALVLLRFLGNEQGNILVEMRAPEVQKEGERRCDIYECSKNITGDRVSLFSRLVKG